MDLLPEQACGVLHVFPLGPAIRQIRIQQHADHGGPSEFAQAVQVRFSPPGQRGTGVATSHLKLISQTRPSARQPKRVLPFIRAIICSVTRLPKPLRVGSCTAGPPVSVQHRCNRRSASCDHFRSTCPLGVDKAPYLAAFVASSCKITAIV
jgi:hypothetical protein